MHIYLSPHHDDVCFSLGHRAGRTGGELVTAFTVTQYTEATLDLPAAPDERIALVTELRREEDVRFAAAAGLNRHELGLPEPPVIGLDPFAFTGLREEVDLLSNKLLPCLRQLLSTGDDGERALLHCPMGIGLHRNHVSMLFALRKAFDDLAEQCDLLLYEDLHYASAPRVRQRGLDLAAKVFAGFALSASVEELDAAAAARKLEWIGFYASQHARPPRMRDFTPASGSSTQPHEIVWQVSRADHR